MFPPRATRPSADSILYFSATLSKICHSAVCEARRWAPHTPPTVIEPPAAPDCGYLLEPRCTFTPERGNPNVSAIVIEITVRVPVPMSWLPRYDSTDPSG